MQIMVLSPLILATIINLELTYARHLSKISLFDTAQLIDPYYVYQAPRSYYLRVNFFVSKTLIDKIGQIDATKEYVKEAYTILQKIFAWHNIKIYTHNITYWDQVDPIASSSYMLTNLNNFASYVKSTDLEYADVYVLIGYYPITGTTVGKAYVGTACTKTGVAATTVPDFYINKPIGLASIMAHEIGHVLGETHVEATDEVCRCPFSDNQCLMNSQLSPWNYDYVPMFHSCSIENIVKRNITCIKPFEEIYFSKEETCGNGYTSTLGGESCDCGWKETCIMRGEEECCDYSTCRLKDEKTMQCSGEDCCEECMYKDSGLCRESKGECDVPDSCSGHSEYCPIDVYVYEGAPCSNGGRCISGDCVNRDDICQEMFPNSNVSFSYYCKTALDFYQKYCGQGALPPSLEALICGVNYGECGRLWCSASVMADSYTRITVGTTLCYTATGNAGLIKSPVGCETDGICVDGRCSSVIKPSTCEFCEPDQICLNDGSCY